MTSQHFRAIAEAIATVHGYTETDEAREAITSVAEHLAVVLRRFNGHFDRDRFLRACRVRD